MYREIVRASQENSQVTTLKRLFPGFNYQMKKTYLDPPCFRLMDESQR